MSDEPRADMGPFLASSSAGEGLRPRDYQRWRELRRQLQQREEMRRKQWRIRKEPSAYLAAIETRLLQ